MQRVLRCMLVALVLRAWHRERLLYALGNNAEVGSSCNEFVCGSVVSKCLLTQSCKCKLTDCHCCKDCFNCLGEFFVECCSCLEMCPQRNDTLSALAPTSQIGDFDGVPELFDTLTAVVEDDDDVAAEWTTLRFPKRASLPRHFDRHFGDAIDRQAAAQKSTAGVNCTVIYLNACTTHKKCAHFCESMGASSYRWFHDGCCECVGAHCFNYGVNESRCLACPEDEDDLSADVADADDYAASDAVAADDVLWDYGEDEINYN